MDIFSGLGLMVDKGASDLFYTVGAPPHMKIKGTMLPIGDVPLTSQQMMEVVSSILNDSQQAEFATTMEFNMALSLENVGRYRLNFFRQRGEVAMVARYIPDVIPAIDTLNLPSVLSTIVMERRGLILVVGGTNVGKSTTLASMIDYRNTHHDGHILTIEDPIEFVHYHKKSIIHQREVGIDTHSFEQALKNAMRESPDVILIGEIRDRKSMKQAISYAETGHLCLSTLHANSANQALERIINFFPEEAKSQLLLDLSLNLRAVISLRLIPSVDGSLVPAVEVLLSTPHMADLIEKGKIEGIKEAMERGAEQGMQTFDQALLKLYKAGKITQENAIHYADSKNNIGLNIRLSESGQVDKASDLTLNTTDDA